MSQRTTYGIWHDSRMDLGGFSAILGGGRGSDSGRSWVDLQFTEQGTLTGAGGGFVPGFTEGCAGAVAGAQVFEGRLGLIAFPWLYGWRTLGAGDLEAQARTFAAVGAGFLDNSGLWLARYLLGWSRGATRAGGIRG